MTTVFWANLVAIERLDDAIEHAEEVVEEVDDLNQHKNV